MESANGTRLTARHALAGLHAGVLGALVMLGYLMIGSLWGRRSVWVIPNLFATTFFGPDAYRNQLLRSSWAGVALVLSIYGLAGILWGFFWGDERKRWIVLYGALTGLAVYFVFFDVFWNHANPLITLYAPDRQLKIAHVLWGMALARSPKYSRRIALVTSDATVEPAAQETVEEVKTGEVIR